MRKLWIVSLLAGCGISGTTPTSTVTGVVEIGDYISGATVFPDLDGNNLLGANPSTTTDATGHFTLTFENPDQVSVYLVAIVDPDSTKANGEPVGFGVHLRAPAREGRTVISPLATLVVGQHETVRFNLPLAEQDVEAALDASTLSFGANLDLFADYVADAETVPDHRSLRPVAAAAATLISGEIDELNAKQPELDWNDGTYSDELLAALVSQLTPLADGTAALTQLTSDQQDDVVANPGAHLGYFGDTTVMADRIAAALTNIGDDRPRTLFLSSEGAFIQDLETSMVSRIAREVRAELME